MTLRRALTSVGLGLTIALGSASAAQADTYVWWNAGTPGWMPAAVKNSAGQITNGQRSGIGSNSAFVGTAQTSTYVVNLQYYYGNGGSLSGIYSSRGSICLDWGGAQPNLGIYLSNPHSFGQYMTSTVYTSGDC